MQEADSGGYVVRDVVRDYFAAFLWIIRNFATMISIWNTDNLETAQQLEPIVLDMASRLSKRSRDAFSEIYKGDLISFVYALLDGDFQWKDQGRLGDKSLKELLDFSEELIALIQENNALKGLEDWGIHKRIRDFRLCGIESEAAKELISLENILGRLPLLALVGKWIDSQNDRDRYIIENSLQIWADRQMMSLQAISSQLNLTSERARQLRLWNFTNLNSFLSQFKSDSTCPYDCFSAELERTSLEEGVSFNANFIRYIIGSVFGGLHIWGDVPNCFMYKEKGGDANAFVAALPDELCKQFDFDAFLSHNALISKESRIDTLRIALPQDETLSGAAGRLAYLQNGWLCEGGAVIVPPNAEKNLPEIMEQIIREAGHPLAIEEIMRVFSLRYPEKIVERSRIRANMQINPNIVPLGRSGVYSLSDWTEGEQRGGTIRSFVKECLEASYDHIVPVGEVLEYVRSFRQSITQTNLLTNLMLETGKMFSVIWKGDESFITFTSDGVPEGYRKISRTVVEKRSFDESIALINSFIEQNGRAPKVGKDEDESRLARFLSNQRSLRKRGLLSERASQILKTVEDKLSDGHQLSLF